jgi:hypothetical protein
MYINYLDEALKRMHKGDPQECTWEELYRVFKLAKCLEVKKYNTCNYRFKCYTECDYDCPVYFDNGELAERINASVLKADER